MFYSDFGKTIMAPTSLNPKTWYAQYDSLESQTNKTECGLYALYKRCLLN